MARSAPRQARWLIAALEFHGDFVVDAVNDAQRTPCRYLLRVETLDREHPAPLGWARVASERRPTERNSVNAIYRREPAR